MLLQVLFFDLLMVMQRVLSQINVIQDMNCFHVVFGGVLAILLILGLFGKIFHTFRCQLYKKTESRLRLQENHQRTNVTPLKITIFHCRTFTVEQNCRDICVPLYNITCNLL